MRHQKINLDFTIFNLIKQGMNPSKISKELKISKQKINYYTRKMLERGDVVKKGYGIWEVKTFSSRTLTKNNKKIRGHAFIWKVKTNKKIDWKKRFEKAKIDYKLVRGLIPRTFIGKKKVWFGKKSLIIYEPYSFYGKNAIESRKYAIISFLETLREIESKLRINLKPYYFNVSREHYAMIKNELARQVNREGDKIRVRDENGEWLWIDMSDGIGELEVGNNKAFDNSLGVQRWYNDMKKHEFKVTPSFLMENINKVTENQMMFANNLETHIEAIKTLKEAVKELKEEIKIFGNGK